MEFDPQSFIRNTFHAAIVEVFLNGIYTAIIITTLCTVVFRHGWRHLSRPLIPVMVLMYMIAAVSAWAQMMMIVRAFLKPRHSETEVSDALTPAHWQSFFVSLAYPVNGIIADCIMIWRCYIIWSRNKWIILIASVITFAQIPFAIMALIWDLHGFTGHRQDIAFFKAIILASTCLSLSSTVITTTLIIYRIMTIGGRKYLPIIEIMVESALLYSVTLVVVLPFGAAEKTYGYAYVPAALNRQMTGIAPALIVTRLLLGVKSFEEKFTVTTTAGEDSTSGHNNHQLSTVRFHPSFTDPTKTEDGVLSTSTDECYECRAGEPSHTLSRSRFYTEGSIEERCEEEGADDDDDDRTTISSCRFENPVSTPRNQSREPI